MDLRLNCSGIEHVFEQVFGVQDAEDFVFVFADDGETGMGGFDDVGSDALDAVVFFQNVHVAAGNHGIAHFQVGKVEDFFQPQKCIRVKHFLLVRLPQQAEYVFGGIGFAGKSGNQTFRKMSVSTGCRPFQYSSSW